MANVINLPQLGQTMEEGTIVNCRVKEGDKVKKGDVIFEVETDKATLEMECPVEGFVKKILVAIDQTVPVNEPIIIIGDKDEIIDNQMPTAPEAKAEKIHNIEKKAEAKITSKTENSKAFVSPRAKMTAKQLGIDLNLINPSDGKPRIMEKDVRKAAAINVPGRRPAPKYKPGQSIAMSKMQKIIGQRMLQSKQEIPCFYLNTTADMTELVEYRAKLKTSGIDVSFNDFIIKAAGMALKQFPILTAQIDEDKIRIADKIAVGLAIAVGDELVAPLCKEPDAKSIEEIANYNKDLIARAKANKLRPDDFNGGCFTLSNLGGFGIESFIPIVVPGQCSILGVGRIMDRPAVKDGNISIRKLMEMTLSVDHKVANGAYAAQFLHYIKLLLEETATFD